MGLTAEGSTAAPVASGAPEPAAKSALPARVVALIAVLACVGIAAALLTDRLDRSPSTPSTVVQLALAVALVLAGRLTVAFRHRGEIDAVDVFEAALTPVIALLPGSRSVLLVALAKVVAQLWLRMPASKLAFNVAQWMACAGLGSLAFTALSTAGTPVAHRLGSLIVAMAVVTVANVAALAMLFWLLPGGPSVRSLFDAHQLIRSLVITAVTVTTGIALAVSAERDRGALLALFGLLILLYFAGRGFALLGAYSDQRRWLQKATHTLSAAIDPRDIADEFLDDVRSSCGARGAELLLYADHDGGTRRSDDSAAQVYRVGVTAETSLARQLAGHLGTGTLPEHIVAVPRPSWRRALSLLARPPFGRPATRDDPRAATVRSAGWRECLAVGIINGDDRVGALLVYDRSGVTEPGPADLAVVRALAHEFSTALERAELTDQALRAQESATRIIDGSNDGIVAVAEDGSVVVWNPALARMTGRPAQQLLGCSVEVLDARDEYDRPVPLELWADGRALPAEFRVQAVDGTARWVSCSYAEDTGGRRGRRMLVAIVRDVTELRRQRALLTEQAGIVEMIASDEPPETSLRSISRLVSAQLRGAAVDVLLIAQDSSAHVLVDDGPRDAGPTLPNAPVPLAPSDEFADLVTIPAEVWEQCIRDGRPLVLDERHVPAWWAMPIIEDPEVGARAVLLVRPRRPTRLDDREVEVLGLAARLTGLCLSREAARARLAHQANHDPLTGLPNRAYFLGRCAAAIRAARASTKPFAVLFVDLDQFKVVNDSLGHELGDELLVAVAERLGGAIRPSDVIARFGGDEFTILCEGVHPQGARVLANRLLALFDDPFQVAGVEVFETASIGITVGTAESRPADLLQQADAAMYRAKDSGGNRYAFFDARTGRRAEARLASYTGLRRAVDESQFKVRYQPIVTVKEGSLAGMEALVRWDHPERGLLSPREFIDLAEETNLIVPVGGFVLRTAVQALPRLTLDGERPARISVNVSARQLMSRQILPDVRRALKDSGVAPHRLSLEITESILLARSSAVLKVIEELRDLGVTLSLDDFGTGHSSLDYLHRVPVDELKIDRRFVAGLTTNHQSAAIVSAVIRLAHDLGLRVVAEGIEHADQAERLAEMGCDLAQGYYFSPPLAAEDVLGGTER